MCLQTKRCQCLFGLNASARRRNAECGRCQFRNHTYNFTDLRIKSSLNYINAACRRDVEVSFGWREGVGGGERVAVEGREIID